MEEALENALGNLEAAKLGFLSLLDGLNTSSNDGLLAEQVDVQDDGTVLVGVAMSVPQDGSPVAFGYGTVTVEVPAAILEGLDVPAVAVMGMVPPSSGLFSLLNSSGGMQSDLLSLDLFVNGTALKDLVQPIQFTLAASDGGQSADCAFWDEELNEWSRTGVSLVSIQNGTIVCATTHLSVFGAILKSIIAALACSNAAAIFSLQGLRNLTSRPWAYEVSAILNWAMLLLGMCLLGLARQQDNKYEEPLAQIQLLRSLKRDKETGEAKGPKKSLRKYVTDELHFIFNRNLAEVAYSKMLQSRTGLSLKELKKLYKVSGHTSMHEAAEDFLKEFEQGNAAKRLSFWYRMNCIWFTIFHPSPKASCLVRTTVLLGEIYSGWALSAMFYGASSIAPGEEVRVANLPITTSTEWGFSCLKPTVLVC